MLKHCYKRNTYSIRWPKSYKVFFYSLFFLLSAFSQASETDFEPIFIAKGEPPPGFEDLLEPQTTAIDIYYGQRYLLTTLATYTPNFLEFHTPKHIINFIPDILNQEKVLQTLSEPLEINSALICRNQNNSNCGRLSPEVAGIIFNADEFRANLFINPLFLDVRKIVEEIYLPSSTADWSFIQSLSASLSGQTDNDDRYSLSGISTLGKLQRRLQSQWIESDSTGLYLETLNYEENYQQYLFQGGLFRSPAYGLNFINQQRLFGGSAATTLETRTDMAIATGSEILVFFSSRSKVEIYKDNRLLDTRFYETGNQIIDTSRFPEGSYNVILKIREDNGIEREETVFFVKSRRLPPVGAPQYFAELGNVIVDIDNNFFPELSKTWVIRSGYTKRLDSKTGFNTGGLITNKLLLAEIGVSHFGLNLDAGSSLMLTTQKDIGLLFNGRYRMGDLSTYLNYRYVSADEDNNLDDPATLEPTRYWDPVPLSTTQSNIGLNYKIGSGSLNVQLRQNEREGQADQNGYSIRYIQSFRLKQDYSLQFNAEISDYDFGSRILFGVHLTHRKNRWTNNLTSNYESQDDEFGTAESGLTLSGSTRWSDGELFESDLKATARAGHEIYRDYIGAGLDYNSSLGEGNFTFESGSLNDNNYTLYAGNATSSFVASKNNFAFGGSRISNSAVIIELSGQNTSAGFDVYVNNQKYDRIRAGKKSLINLPPYNTYTISIVPVTSKNDFVDFDNKTETITLYPGNVHHISWAVEKLLLVYGMATDPSGEPIKNARIEGAKGLAYSDEGGIFQAELSSDADILDFKSPSGSCYVSLPPLSIEKSILNLGKVICQ